MNRSEANTYFNSENETNIINVFFTFIVNTVFFTNLQLNPFPDNKIC